MSDRRECRYGACDCCEQLPKVKQERAEARAVAREVTRQMFYLLGYGLRPSPNFQAVLDAYPWLKEASGDG